MANKQTTRPAGRRNGAGQVSPSNRSRGQDSRAAGARPVPSKRKDQLDPAVRKVVRARAEVLRINEWQHAAHGEYQRLLLRLTPDQRSAYSLALRALGPFGAR